MKGHGTRWDVGTWRDEGTGDTGHGDTREYGNTGRRVWMEGHGDMVGDGEMREHGDVKDMGRNGGTWRPERTWGHKGDTGG